MIEINIKIDDSHQVTITKKEEPVRFTPKQKPEREFHFGVTKEKTCINCGKKFQPTSNVQKYCTEKCRPEPLVKKKEYPTPEEIERSQSKPYKEY